MSRRNLAVIGRCQRTIGTGWVKAWLWRTRSARSALGLDDTDENLGQAPHVDVELAKLPGRITVSVRAKLFHEFVEGRHGLIVPDHVLTL